MVGYVGNFIEPYMLITNSKALVNFSNWHGVRVLYLFFSFHTRDQTRLRAYNAGTYAAKLNPQPQDPSYLFGGTDLLGNKLFSFARKNHPIVSCCYVLKIIIYVKIKNACKIKI